ncbi:hypothetical protein KKA53_04055 [Candidatus Dependentiae bacterium]|nr:hypothetical protein [Candidatus Dependentiae bacterium]
MKKKKVTAILLLAVFFAQSISIVVAREERGILGQFLSGFTEQAGEDVSRVTRGVGAEVERTGGLVSGAIEGLMGAGVSIKERAKRAYRVAVGLGVAFLKIFLRVNIRGWYLFYKQRYFKFKVDIKIDKVQEFEVEYDLGFSGGGVWSDGFKPVRAKILATEELDIGGAKMSPDGLVFLGNIQAQVEQWRQKYALIPFASLAVRGVSELVGKIKNMMRLRPQTVFLIKVYSLIRSAMEPSDSISFFDATLQLPILLSRLAFSINEDVVGKALTFAETGIDKIFDFGPLVVIKDFLDTIQASVRERFITEWKERKVQKGLTDLELAYSMMRRTNGYVKQTAYFMEQILPILDKKKLDLTDQELFVKAVRVHVVRRYQGLLKTMNVFGFSEAESIDERAETEAIMAAGKMPTRLENEVAVVKAVVVYRGLIPATNKDMDKGLLLMVAKALEKMKNNNGGTPFSRVYLNVVGAIAAQLRAEGVRLKKFTDQVTWPAKLEEGQTLDSIGQDEDALSFAKDFSVPRMQDYPFGVPPELSNLFKVDTGFVDRVAADTGVSDTELFGGEAFD